ncbi:hypothetical protein BGX29_002626 [Mortierella sp. GBA35]|nr:hypothetical protein BGX29_002626 [Mortierella sp. GBA35]
MSVFTPLTLSLPLVDIISPSMTKATIDSIDAISRPDIELPSPVVAPERDAIAPSPDIHHASVCVGEPDVASTSTLESEHKTLASPLETGSGPIDSADTDSPRSKNSEECSHGHATITTLIRKVATPRGYFTHNKSLPSKAFTFSRKLSNASSLSTTFTVPQLDIVDKATATVASFGTPLDPRTQPVTIGSDTRRPDIAKPRNERIERLKRGGIFDEQADEARHAKRRLAFGSCRHDFDEMVSSFRKVQTCPRAV